MGRANKGRKREMNKIKKIAILADELARAVAEVRSIVYPHGGSEIRINFNLKFQDELYKISPGDGTVNWIDHELTKEIDWQKKNLDSNIEGKIGELKARKIESHQLMMLLNQ